MTVEVWTDLDRRCVNAIRTLSIDAVQKADSGHPGLPLGAAPMAYVLWRRHLKFDPADPTWPDRDRFVLSAGHGSMLLYSLLHLFGYNLSLDDLKSFRQWGSKTPGHPEAGHTPGVECTTGPLGQGAGAAVGMAIAERYLAHLYNRPGHPIVDHRVYALVSDGDLMEGVSAEACALAGHLRLGKLVFLYDSNDVTLDGPARLCFTEDVAKRFESYGWSVQRVKDGNADLAAIDRALEAARAETGRPSLIEIKTTLGFGSPHKQNTSEAHGAPLGEEEVKLTKQALGSDPEKKFFVPAEVYPTCSKAADQGANERAGWLSRFEAWAKAHPDLAQSWQLALGGRLPEGYAAAVPAWGQGEKAATRVAAGKALVAIAAKVPWIIGGDADLSGSTKTNLPGAGDFNGQTGEGRNLHFGVREHAMAAIVNGMAYHRGVIPYASTFLVFCDYMRPSIRLAAMNRLHLVYVWTHDSIAVGEDGPTHQPVEQVMCLRAVPGLKVIRPADPNETAHAWRLALERGDGPAALILSRQNVPALGGELAALTVGLKRGAYVLAEAEGGAPQAVILATGAEVHLALGARAKLAHEGIKARVVSMPCWEVFAEQDQTYRHAVLPPGVKARVSVEAGITLGWERWIGDQGVAVGIDRFGASAPGAVNLEKFGFTPDRVAAAVKQTLGRG